MLKWSLATLSNVVNSPTKDSSPTQTSSHRNDILTSSTRSNRSTLATPSPRREYDGYDFDKYPKYVSKAYYVPTLRHHVEEPNDRPEGNRASEGCGMINISTDIPYLVPREERITVADDMNLYKCNSISTISNQSSHSTTDDSSHVNHRMADSLESTTGLNPDLEYRVRWTDTDSEGRRRSGRFSPGPNHYDSSDNGLLETSNEAETVIYHHRSEISLADVLDQEGVDDNNRYSIISSGHWRNSVGNEPKSNNPTISPYTGNFKEVTLESRPSLGGPQKNSVESGSRATNGHCRRINSTETLVSIDPMGGGEAFGDIKNDEFSSLDRPHLSPIPFPRTPPASSGSRRCRTTSTTKESTSGRKEDSGPKSKDSKLKRTDDDKKNNIISALADYYNFQQFLVEHKIKADQITTAPHVTKRGVKDANRWVRVIPNGETCNDDNIYESSKQRSSPNPNSILDKIADSYPARGRLTPYRSTDGRTGSEKCLATNSADHRDDSSADYGGQYSNYMSGALPPFGTSDLNGSTTTNKEIPSKSRSHTEGFRRLTNSAEPGEHLLPNESVMRALNHEVKVKAAGLLRSQLSPVCGEGMNLVDVAAHTSQNGDTDHSRDNFDYKPPRQHREGGNQTRIKLYEQIIQSESGTNGDTYNTQRNPPLVIKSDAASPDMPFVDDSVSESNKLSPHSPQSYSTFKGAVDKNDSGIQTGSNNGGSSNVQDGGPRSTPDSQGVEAGEGGAEDSCYRYDPRVVDGELRRMMGLRRDGPPIPTLPFSPSVVVKNRKKRRALMIIPASKHNGSVSSSNILPDGNCPNDSGGAGPCSESTTDINHRRADPFQAQSTIYPPIATNEMLGTNGNNGRIGNVAQLSLASLPAEARRGDYNHHHPHRLPLSPTFPPTFYTASQGAERPEKLNRRPARIVPRSRPFPIHLYAITDPKQTFFGILSYLYGLFLIVMGVVLPLAEVFTPKVSYMFYEGFYLYLYCGSILFLLYAYCFLLNKKPINESYSMDQVCKEQEDLSPNLGHIQRGENGIRKTMSTHIGKNTKGNLSQERKMATLQEESNLQHDFGHCEPEMEYLGNEFEKRKQKKISNKINGVVYKNTLERERISKNSNRPMTKGKGSSCCGTRRKVDKKNLASDCSESYYPHPLEDQMSQGYEKQNQSLEDGCSIMNSSSNSGHPAGHHYNGEDYDEHCENGHSAFPESTTAPLLQEGVEDLKYPSPYVSGPNMKKDYRDPEYSQHTGSFYLRMGAVAFATGSMIFNGLKFGQSFELATNPPCFNIFRGILPLMHLIFTFFQLYFIFLNSKMCINRYKVFAKFGLMHMLATNICVFLSTIIKETVHDIVSKGLYNYPAEVNLTIQSPANTSTISSCRQKYMMGNIVKDASPFLYPCNVEYSIICASILYVMWSNIGSFKQSGRRIFNSIKNILILPNGNGYDITESHDTSRTEPSPSQVDCKGSSKGLFAGILTLVMCIICLILFFVLIKNPLYNEVAFFLSSCSEITVYSLTILAIVISLIRTKWMGRTYRRQRRELLADLMRNPSKTDTTVGWYDKDGYLIHVVPRAPNCDSRSKDYYYRFSNVDNTLENNNTATPKTQFSHEYLDGDERAEINAKNFAKIVMASDKIVARNQNNKNVDRMENSGNRILKTQNREGAKHVVGLDESSMIDYQVPSGPDELHKHGLGELDYILQFMSILGEYTLAGFSVVSTYRSLKTSNNEAILVMATAILSAIQVTCQTVFLLDQFSTSSMASATANRELLANIYRKDSSQNNVRRRKSGSLAVTPDKRCRSNGKYHPQGGYEYDNLATSGGNRSSSFDKQGNGAKDHRDRSHSALPPRQLVTFLLVANLALWAVDTFAIERAKANPVQATYFGPLVWSIITHTCVPLIIFYRFHSSICLAEIWKVC